MNGGSLVPCSAPSGGAATLTESHLWALGPVAARMSLLLLLLLLLLVPKKFKRPAMATVAFVAASTQHYA